MSPVPPEWMKYSAVSEDEEIMSQVGRKLSPLCSLDKRKVLTTGHGEWQYFCLPQKITS
jgi:hypothetical protein